MNWEDRVVNWEYRVVKRTWPDRDEAVFSIHEVFYEEGVADPVTFTVEPVEAQGETIEELRADLVQQLAALDKPVLDYDSIGAKRKP